MVNAVAEQSMSAQVAEAGRIAKEDPSRAEEIYRAVLGRKAGKLKIALNHLELESGKGKSMGFWREGAMAMGFGGHYQ